MKKINHLLLIGLISYFANILDAHSFPLITNVAERKVISLDGQWNIIIDPIKWGFGAKYYSYKEPTDKTKYISYSFDDINNLRVPGDWNTQRSELLYYEGTIWYRKKFNYQLEKGNRLFLHFGAVNYESIIYLNGEELGKHVGGYTPFNFEITRNLRDGENLLVVMVNNERHVDGIPGLEMDWWNFGGITRPVTLVETPETFIRDYSIQLNSKDKNLIDGWVQLDGLKLYEQIDIEIPELKIKRTIHADVNGRAAFEIKAKPKYWSPENPKLYSVNITSKFDKISENIGFRTIRTQGKKIVLNGEEIFLRGVNIHAQVYGRSAYSKEDAALLLSWAKELGCNFVRLAHYPHSEETIRLAEQMGLLVWEEVPVYWKIRWNNPETYVNAETQIEEMISRDKNRANVIIWAIGNETPQSDERLLFLTKLANRVKELDKQRFISSALSGERYIRPNVKSVVDKLIDQLDILSFNQYNGWFGGSPEICDKIDWEFDIQKPILMTEFGASAPYDNHGDKAEKYTVEHQEYYYQKTVEMIKRIPELSGICPWNLYEHRTPLRVMPKIEDGFSRAGLISFDGHRKKAFYVMKKWYDELAEKDK